MTIFFLLTVICNHFAYVLLFCTKVVTLLGINSTRPLHSPTVQKALSTSATLYLRRITLFLTARPQVESPDRQADTFRLPLRIVFHGKSQSAIFCCCFSGQSPKNCMLHASLAPKCWICCSGELARILYRTIGFWAAIKPRLDDANSAHIPNFNDWCS